MGMDFWGQVWKRVWEIAFFGLKLGLDLEMRAAHPHQKFQGVPPPRIPNIFPLQEISISLLFQRGFLTLPLHHP